ncbi:PolC-type DNA polymerase III [Lutibacter sp. B2]|nr:PolC-type DNA polymerase III [Lutibacter sp. B2]
MNLSADVTVTEIEYYKKDRVLQFELIANEIISKLELNKLNNHIKKDIPFIKEVKFKVSYVGVDLHEKFDRYWENIIYELKEIYPASLAWLNDAKVQFNKDTLEIALENEMAIEAIKRKNIDKFISRKINLEFNIQIQIMVKVYDDRDIITKDTYLKEKKIEMQSIVKDIIKNENKIIKNTSNKSEIKSDVILGKKNQDVPIPISSVNEEAGIVTIQGELFDIDTRELKNGKVLFNLSLTDYNGSIGVKVFAKKEQEVDLSEALKTGRFFRCRGEARYDTFSKELIIMGRDIVKALPQVREDHAKDKRIELHAHTQMSAMDAVNTAASLVNRAAKWGHAAIAITDHGVVQAFPEAMEAAKKHGIKIIYGVEGYCVNDGEAIVQNCNDQDIEQPYVVFDLETTGLSSKNDKITEIGAVKIQHGEIVDRFNVLVNPERAIPLKIIELTKITDEMVKDQPTIQEVLPRFLSFVGECVVVAHNANFDVSFIKENCKDLKKDFNNPVLDTLKLSKILLTKLKRYKLNIIAKELGIELKNHHRAIDDAEATAKIFLKFLEMIAEKNVTKLSDLNNLYSNNVDVKKLDTFHTIILVKNYTGLKNLYKIISKSHMEYFYKRPRIPKSLLSQMREGLIIGTACEAGELYKAILNNKSEREIEDIIKYYDYLEIQPIMNNNFLIQKGFVKDEEELREINRQIFNLGEKFSKPVVATGDVHFLDPKDEAHRRVLMGGQGFKDADNQPPLYFKTTDEMLKEFDYLGKENAKKVVIEDPKFIEEQIEKIIPIPEETFTPVIEGSDEDLRNMCYEKATRIYGDPIPEIVKDRLDKELNSIISNGYAVLYIISQKLVTKSMQDGYLVGSRGSVGSSFVATMSDITEVNPLPPHYVCPNCKHSEFITDGSIGSGADLPDKKCTVCDEVYVKDGHDIPFEVFLGFEGDKEPDIDLNFAGEYQANAHKYTEELFGEGHVFRAGTIGTVASKTAYGFVKKYFDEKEMVVNNREIERLLQGCTGVKRTTGQHPGGVMVVPHYKDIFEFCPIQYPANDSSSGVITTHFDYHSISGRLLKLDILGHDVPTIIRMLQDITGLDPTKIPLGDKDTISIFTSPKALKIQDNEFDCEVGSLGVPEFGTKFVRQMLMDTKPTTFAELVRISGLSHGTDVWLNNAQDLVRQNIAELKDVISTRDDIMNYLILKGLPPKSSFKIMEKVRKGKGLTEEDEKMMRENHVPEWYIDSCNKIKYMFPKAHAVAYVMMSFRLAYFKVHYPLAFYATYFTIKVSDFDAELVVKGKKAIKERMKELELLGNVASQKEKDSLTVLEVAYEMYCREFGFEKVDIYESDSDQFIISQNALLPPLRGLQGVGENAAKSISECRKDRKFMSIEDLRERAKVTKTVIENLKNHGCLDGLPDTNQLSLF